jgi:hypothetical protein
MKCYYFTLVLPEGELSTEQLDFIDGKLNEALSEICDTMRCSAFFEKTDAEELVGGGAHRAPNRKRQDGKGPL